MLPSQEHAIGRALGAEVLGTRTLAGGFSHETSLVSLSDRQVVARVGGTAPAIEAAVMAAARRVVPVPEVLCTLPGVTVLEYVAGSMLSEVLSADTGAEVGRVLATIGQVTFDRPGFFTDASLATTIERPWSAQLPEFAEACMAKTDRLDPPARMAWAALCATHAPALTAIDGQARLVHSDANPKNILVMRDGGGWRVTAVLDWEFSYAGSPYADAANMLRFGETYPAAFRDAFRGAFAEHQPAGLPEDWLYLGHVQDMFALSDLVTRPAGNPVADQAADRIRQWLADGVPGA